MSWLSSGTIRFLAGLRANNDRQWFAQHKADYEDCVKHPGEAFAAALAGEIETVQGEPHLYRIFRIHRDVRFSKDKTPYNAHLHISLSRKGAGRNGGPAWMVGLDPDGLALGVGIFAFTPAQLDRWRALCAGAEGAFVAGLLDRLEEQTVRIAEPELKRVPAPYAADHPRAALLRRKGLTAWIDHCDAEIAYGPDGPRNCAQVLAKLQEIFGLLVSLG
jgi:uncharacterized protein (TIGR02453 family)